MTRAVFLDRDGVVIEAVVREGKPYPPQAIDDVRIDPEAANALSRLTAAGYRLILITNQPDVSRGIQDRSTVETINNLLCTRLPIEACFVCYHDDSDHCGCRKPQPGLILMAADQYNIDLTMSFVVGDRWRDVAAGHAAGCRTVWIDHGYKEKWQAIQPDVRVTGLKEAAQWIVAAGQTL
jgi:D-glycero-D-manno-heptose 1,7-bisphosphate phosphatase